VQQVQFPEAGEWALPEVRLPGISSGEVAMADILSIAAGCLALSVVFMLSTWAILLGVAGILIGIEEIRNWWRGE